MSGAVRPDCYQRCYHAGGSMVYQPRVDVPLFLERAAVLRSSRATASIDRAAFRWEWSREPPSEQVTVTGPDDEATTAFFVRLRDFDIPGKMVYVGKYIDLLASSATGNRALVLEHVRAAHDVVGLVPHRWHTFVLGDDAKPRQVWELWTYGFVLHDDPDKREKYASLDPLRQGMVRWISHVYAADVYHVVTVVEAMLRDPELDLGRVRTQFWGTRPEFQHMVPPDEIFMKPVTKLVGDE
jgi:hypothetical protein